MDPFVRAGALLLVCIAWSGEPQQALAGSCDTVHTVTVSPEEYMEGVSLTDLMSHLISTGRRMAVEQVTTTRVLSASSETIHDDDVDFRSHSSERVVGTVNSHKVVAREFGKIGTRETLRVTLQVDVCVGPADQIWYVRIDDLVSETKGDLAWMKSRLKSPTDRIQLVRPGELGAEHAPYRIEGLAFSEKASVHSFTNDDQIRRYDQCVQTRRSQAQTQMQFLNSFGLGNFGSVVRGAGDPSRACGDRPRHTRGNRLEAEAVFEIKICDTHIGNCQVVRQRHDSRTIVRTKEDAEVAHRQFYHEGFGFVGAIALHTLQRSLGMLDR
ncbi:MAG: hypothetical protein OXE86_07735 [Alphaproteobacteria bacterium]|nr:hypothetical protein [Alphaproteobacteria bacterium]